MTVTRDSVVTIHYTLKDEAGDVIESSVSREPLAYLHGHGHLIAGLERELEGKKAGDRLNVTIPAQDAYGEYDEQLVQQVPRRALEGIPDLRTGMRLQAHTPQGAHAVTVTE